MDAAVAFESIREQALERLASQYAAGNLRLATLELRLEAAWRATTPAELDDVAWDLPPSKASWPALRKRVTGRPAAGLCRSLDFELWPRLTLHLDESPRTWVIGRSTECDVVLSDTAVSRRHALISLRGNRCALRDLRSTNGTWVNGRPVVHTAVLHPGDIITIGRVIDGLVC